MSGTIFRWPAAGTMALTAATHSLLGERRLIVPLLAGRHGIAAAPLARQVLRFAWHLTSLLMLLCALFIVWPGSDPMVDAIVGAGWLAAGLVDLVYSRGRHIAWPLLVGAGGFALAGSAA